MLSSVFLFYFFSSFSAPERYLSCSNGSSAPCPLAPTRYPHSPARYPHRSSALPSFSSDQPSFSSASPSYRPQRLACALPSHFPQRAASCALQRATSRASEQQPSHLPRAQLAAPSPRRASKRAEGVRRACRGQKRICSPAQLHRLSHSVNMPTSYKIITKSQ